MHIGPNKNHPNDKDLYQIEYKDLTVNRIFISGYSFHEKELIDTESGKYIIYYKRDGQDYKQVKSNIVDILKVSSTKRRRKRLEKLGDE